MASYPHKLIDTTQETSIWAPSGHFVDLQTELELLFWLYLIFKVVEHKVSDARKRLLAINNVYLDNHATTNIIVKVIFTLTLL